MDDKLLNILVNNVLLCASIKKITNYQIAKDAKISHSTLSRILNKQQSPSTEVIYKIAMALQVEPYKLLMPDFDKNSTIISRDIPTDILNLLEGQPPHVLDTIRTILINLGIQKKVKIAD